MSAPTAPSPQTSPPPSAPPTDSEALRIVLEQTKQQLASLERDKREADLLSSVVFGHDGLESSNLGGLWRLANMYSRSDIVPEHYRGKPENCLIALQMSQRCKVDPFAFMQSSYMVHGKPGLEGKLAIAMLNSSGKIVGRIRYELTGEGLKRACAAIVKDKDTGEDIRLTVDWAMVQAEGWDKKSGSKWLTIPDQMFRYRSATFLIRAHYPEVLMGLRTTDELEEEATTTTTTTAPPVGRINLSGNANGHPAKSAVPEDPPPSAPGGDGYDPEEASKPQGDKPADGFAVGLVEVLLAQRLRVKLYRCTTDLEMQAWAGEVLEAQETLGDALYVQLGKAGDEHRQKLAQEAGAGKKSRRVPAPT